VEIAGLSLILAAISVGGVISARATAISTPIFSSPPASYSQRAPIWCTSSLSPFDEDHRRVTLVWVPFADACRMRFFDLRADLGYSFRLLAMGLPLTTGLGAAAIAAEAGRVDEGPAGMPGLVCFWAP
jgi:hypothetical protein